MMRLLSLFLNAPDRKGIYAYDAAQQLGLSYGATLPMFTRLKKANVLKAVWEDIDPAAEGRPKRRLYHLTDKGRAFARREVEVEIAFLQGSQVFA